MIRAFNKCCSKGINESFVLTLHLAIPIVFTCSSRSPTSSRYLSPAIVPSNVWGRPLSQHGPAGPAESRPLGAKLRHGALACPSAPPGVRRPSGVRPRQAPSFPRPARYVRDAGVLSQQLAAACHSLVRRVRSDGGNWGGEEDSCYVRLVI